jgi:4-hydroxy-3-polyprenylbenzoate decarboxylase
MRFIVAMTGATGSIYGVRLLEELKKNQVETHLIMTRWAGRVLAAETGYTIQDLAKYVSCIYDSDDLGAAISSGSYKNDGMVIIPCSMKTLSSIANGYADNLVARSADVTIKEKRKLILVPRETPLSPIHLENMLKLSKINVTILPPMPAFYHRPQTIDDLVNHLVSRVLDQLGIDNSLFERWDSGRMDEENC